ncbi:hypothetical protein [Actinomadura hibisca]|nr:hypothetical protein [Actinomadura hibisca]
MSTVSIPGPEQRVTAARVATDLAQAVINGSPEAGPLNQAPDS